MRTLTRLTLALLLSLASLSSHAVFRAYISIFGSDANPCSLGAPCRLLSTGMNVVDDGGEIWIMDSGNFNIGTIAITKSVSIVAMPGVTGSILGLNAPAFTINSAQAKVALKNLVIRTLPGSTVNAGVKVLSASSLNIENCTLSDLDNAVDVTGTASVQITDTTIRNSVNAAVVIADGTSLAVARSTFSGNGYGLLAKNTGVASDTSFGIEGSVFTGNFIGVYAINTGAGNVAGSIGRSQIIKSGFGIYLSGGNTSVKVAITGNQIANNSVGVAAYGPGASGVLSDNTISGNTTGISQNGISILSTTGSNTLLNTTNTSGTVSPANKS